MTAKRTFVRAAVVIASIAVSAVCVRLGLWQLSRHVERRDRNQKIEARMAEQPLAPAEITYHDSLDYRRVVLNGVFDFDHEIVAYNRVVNGRPAVYLTTPIVTSDSIGFLVERGWVPSADARAVDVERFLEPDTSEVLGLLLPVEPGREPSSWDWPLFLLRAEPALVAGRLDYPLAPWIVRRLELPVAVPEGLGLAPEPELTLGSHLSYTIQWFIFATIALFGPVVVFFAKKRDPSGPTIDSTRAEGESLSR
ncbi:MAG: SURF1 family protein [Gemmatimonadota bacterium]|nr:SURF1 family protein [Gemmatimonadota bacterium]MDH5805141.1 SURF1 family protein [Gemmatimonadota bacterium]